MPTAFSSSSARAARLLLRDVAVEQDRLDELPADRVHRVQRRHRVLEDHRDLVAADLAQPRAAASSAGPRPSKSASPVEIVLRFGLRPMIVRHVTLLPQPDSPTIPSVLPFSTEKRDAVDGLDDAVVGAEVSPQVAYLEKRHQWSAKRA